MMKNKASVQEVIEIFKLIEPFMKRMDGLRESDRCIEYVLLGSQLVEYVLQKILVMYEHSVNLSLYAAEDAAGSSFELQIQLPINGNREGIGSMLDTLKNVYKCHDKALILDLENLNNHRINSTHRIIKDYKGDVERLNNELGTYIRSYKNHDPIKDVLLKLAILQKDLTEDSRMRLELRKKKES